MGKRKRGLQEKVSLKYNSIHPGIFRSTLLPDRKRSTPLLWTQEGRIPFGSARHDHRCVRSLRATTETVPSHAQDEAFLTIE